MGTVRMIRSQRCQRSNCARLSAPITQSVVPSAHPAEAQRMLSSGHRSPVPCLARPNHPEPRPCASCPSFSFLPAPALADDCALRLQTLLATDLTADGPYTAMNTNVMAGRRAGLPAVLRLRPAFPGRDDLAPRPARDAALRGLGLACRRRGRLDARVGDGRRRGRAGDRGSAAGRPPPSKAPPARGGRHRSPSKARSAPRRISDRRRPWATWWTPPRTRCWN
jgi:hypothetical protein